MGNIIIESHYSTKYFMTYDDEYHNRKNTRSAADFMPDENNSADSGDLEDMVIFGEYIDHNKREKYMEDFKKRIPREYEEEYILKYYKDISYEYWR